MTLRIHLDDHLIFPELILGSTSPADTNAKVNTDVQLYEHVCDERECTDIGCANPDIPGAVLLTPAEYEIVDEAKLPELVRLLSVGQLTGSPVGGLTFGAHVPEIKNRGQRVSYPSGPTWQVKPCATVTDKAKITLIRKLYTFQHVHLSLVVTAHQIVAHFCSAAHSRSVGCSFTCPH